MSIRNMFLQVCVLGLLAAITSGLLLYQESQRSRRAADRQLAHEELFRLNDFVETLVLSRQRSAAQQPSAMQPISNVIC